MSGIVTFSSHVTNEELSACVGCIDSGLPIPDLDKPIDFSLIPHLAELVFDTDIKLNRKPKQKIIKMAKKEHVDAFLVVVN